MKQIHWPQADLEAFARRDSYFKAALVCKRGHVLNSGLSPVVLASTEKSQCSTCGIGVIDSCQKCSFRLKGTYFSPMVVSFQNFTPTNFCDNCGAAMPWVTRQERIWEIENLLEEAELSADENFKLKELLQQLNNANLDESDEFRLWLKFKGLVGGYFENTHLQAVLSDLLSAYMRTKLGIN